MSGSGPGVGQTWRVEGWDVDGAGGNRMKMGELGQGWGDGVGAVQGQGRGWTGVPHPSPCELTNKVKTLPSASSRRQYFRTMFHKTVKIVRTFKLKYLCAAWLKF